MVTFYDLDNTGKPTNPVLYLDTLKVSTIEQTAENVAARGGKGNANLIMWDYGKEITVTLEDALFSAKSMAIMFGNGKAVEFATTTSDNKNYIMKTEQFTLTSNAATTGALTGAGWNSMYTDPNGKVHEKVNPKFYDATGASITTGFSNGQTYFCTYDLEGLGSIIEISANSFPGTYYVTGDTFARSEASGKDEFFQFIIPKAKVTSENTITLEAEGDPSVFNMNLQVLRPKDGVMMKLVKYDLTEGTDAGADAVTLVHNHTLTPETT